MSTTMFVVLLIVGILVAVGALIAIPLLWWLPRRSEAAAAQFAAELAGEPLVRGPEKGSYRGASAPGYPTVKNAGFIALTARRLVFRTLTGTTIEVPVAEITGVREATAFKGSVVGGQTHLIIDTAAGEIAFYVFSGNPAWVTALTGLQASS